MIKRYEAYAVEVSGDSPWVSHEEDVEGDWVRYGDHAAELATLRAENALLTMKIAGAESLLRGDESKPPKVETGAYVAKEALK